MTHARFIVIPSNEANAAFGDFGLDPNSWSLVETDGEKPIRFIGADGGEPEDQTLVRDWNWVATEMNAVDAEAHERISALESALTDALYILEGDEWNGSDSYNMPQCDWCHVETRRDDDSDLAKITSEHTADCKMAAAIAEARALLGATAGEKR